MHEFEDLLTLSQAAKVAPGRPSSNCLWRWCRRGVLSRGGERVYLQCARVGGKVFTRAQWLEDFGRALAEADAEHFRLHEGAASAHICSHRKKQRERFEQHRRDSITSAVDELEQAGL